MRPVIPSFMTAAIVCSVVAWRQAGPAGAGNADADDVIGGGQRASRDLRPGAGAFKAEINPTNNGTVTGIATMSGSQGGNTTVIAMTLGGPRGTYIWHIPRGQVRQHRGVLMGDKSNYPAVTVGDSGQITFRTNLNFYPPAGGTYAIEVHQGSDPASEGKVVACGTLKQVYGP